MELTQEQIQKLLAPEPRYVSKHKPNSVNGPVKYYDRTLRCASRGCSAPTYIKVEGVPYCYSHAIITLNDLVIEMQDVLKARLA